MDIIKSEITKIIDDAFNVELNNDIISLKSRLEKTNLLKSISEKVIDECLDLLNNKYPDKAKEFAATGFINNYFMKKQSEFLFKTRWV